MRYFWSVAGVLLAAFAAGGAGAARLSSSGDSCSATGKGTAYTLSVMVPSTAPQQFGFAVGVPGAKVTNMVLQDNDGSFSPASGQTNVSGQWITISPLPPGTATLNVTTSAPLEGAFTVAPVSSPPSGLFDPISCAVANPTPAPVPAAKAALTVGRPGAYDAKAGGWPLSVSITTAGTVRALQQEPTVGTSGAKSTTVKSLVQVRHAGLKTGGKVTLVIRPTATGMKTLATKGALSVRLTVSLTPSTGKQVLKVVSLKLKRAM